MDGWLICWLNQNTKYLTQLVSPPKETDNTNKKEENKTNSTPIKRKIELTSSNQVSPKTIHTKIRPFFNIKRSQNSINQELQNIKNIFLRYTSNQEPSELFLTESEFEEITKICSLPKYTNHLLFNQIHKYSTTPKRISFKDLLHFWSNSISSQKRFSFTENENPKYRLFHILYNSIKTEQPTLSLTMDHFNSLILQILKTHPSLSFLNSTKNNRNTFSTHYKTTVIARIFYDLNQHYNKYQSFNNQNIILSDFMKSNFYEILSDLECMKNINDCNQYFSYEHFYVIYCKFYELDTDHDLMINASDLCLYADRSITSKVIERIFHNLSFGQRIICKMSYLEFIPFILSEENKRSNASIEYWFRVLDLDDNGILSAYEIEYYFVEQQERIYGLCGEKLCFMSFLRQLNDMISPDLFAQFTIADLKKSKLAFIFFDMIFNLNKFAMHEQRDVEIIDDVHNTPYMNDWDRYASQEYISMVMDCK